MSAANKKARLNLEETESTENNPLAQEFETLLETYDHKFDRADIVGAVVTGFENNGVAVDIGAKSMALLPKREVSDNRDTNIEELLPIGEKIDVYVLRFNESDERIIVSRKRVAQARSWEDLQEIADKGDVISCTITNTVKGGVLVDAKGIRGFVPASHLRLRDGIDDLIGKEIPLKILSIEPQNNNLIMSHKKVVNEQLAEQRKDIFDTLDEGTLVEGQVVRLTDFGAFVDLGGVDGLLPLSQMSWRWVEHPSDIYNIGDKVRVEVIGVDPERQRVSLSVKSQYEDPWTLVGNELGLGDEVEGTITRIKHFGAFVEVFPGVEALLPSKELTDEEHRLSKQLKQNDRIVVQISKFSPEERRIALSFSGEDTPSADVANNSDDAVAPEADVEEVAAAE